VKRSNRLVILVGVLLAVLAFVGVFIVLNQQPPEGDGEDEVLIDVLVATEDIDVDEPITPDKVEIDEVAADAVVGTRFSDPSQLIGEPAVFAIAAGAQVPREALGGGLVGPEQQLQPGEKAIAFQVDRVTGLDFLITPGDHIDVVISQNVNVLQQTADSVAEQADNPDAPPRFETIPGLEAARTVKTILTDKRVLYVSDTRRTTLVAEATPSPGQQEPAPATAQIENVIIVFAGSDQDAEVIKFAQNDLGEIGSLTAILRRAADADEGVPEEETTGITIDILFELYGIPVPDIIVDLGPEESPAP